MRKAVVLGVLGFVAICSIVFGGHRSDATMKSEAVLDFPVPSQAATTNKADRLQTTLLERDLELPKRVVEASFVTPRPEPTAPSPKISRSSPPSDFVPRHWRDPYAPKPEAQKRGSATKKSVKRAAEKLEASNAKDCPSDGFVPLLRKLKLAADCAS